MYIFENNWMHGYNVPWNPQCKLLYSRPLGQALGWDQYILSLKLFFSTPIYIWEKLKTWLWYHIHNCYIQVPWVRSAQSGMTLWHVNLRVTVLRWPSRSMDLLFQNMKTPTTLCYNKGIDILNNIKEGCPKLRIQMALLGKSKTREVKTYATNGLCNFH